MSGRWTVEILLGILALLSRGDFQWHSGGFLQRLCSVYRFAAANQVIQKQRVIINVHVNSETNGIFLFALIEIKDEIKWSLVEIRDDSLHIFLRMLFMLQSGAAFSKAQKNKAQIRLNSFGFSSIRRENMLIILLKTALLRPLRILCIYKPCLLQIGFSWCI